VTDEDFYTLLSFESSSPANRYRILFLNVLFQ
jgi:hypothetical protein